MSETLNKAVAFLDAGVAELDTPTQAVADRSVVERRCEPAARGIALRVLDDSSLAVLGSSTAVD